MKRHFNPWDISADIDLVHESGKLRVLSESPKKYVYEVLEDRAVFIPLAIDSKSSFKLSTKVSLNRSEHIN